MKLVTRRRGTAIIETPKGILLTADKLAKFILPGGGAEKGETVKNATIRELKEETGLSTVSIKYLFKQTDRPYKNDKPHKYLADSYIKDINYVFLVKTIGTPKPKEEILRIAYYTPNSKVDMYRSSKEIIRKFYKLKQCDKI
jgi:8-oxo-dGTP diphosphatase